MSKVFGNLLIVYLYTFCNGIEILFGPDNMIYDTILNDWFVKESDVGNIFGSNTHYYTLGGDTLSLRFNGPDNEMHLKESVSTVGYKNIQGILRIFHVHIYTCTYYMECMTQHHFHCKD